MRITEITEDKRQYMDLLLLADEQEDMVERYLDRGTMYLLEDRDARAVCVVTDEGEGVLEIKNLAVAPLSRRKGYGARLVRFVRRIRLIRFVRRIRLIRCIRLVRCVRCIRLIRLIRCVRCIRLIRFVWLIRFVRFVRFVWLVRCVRFVWLIRFVRFLRILAFSKFCQDRHLLFGHGKGIGSLVSFYRHQLIFRTAFSLHLQSGQFISGKGLLINGYKVALVCSGIIL